MKKDAKTTVSIPYKDKVGQHLVDTLYFTLKI